MPALLLAAALFSSGAEESYETALRHLAAGDPAAAESAARQALELSSRFVPEQEIDAAPEKNLLFEEMIAEARASYRQRRGRYFFALGRALTGQGYFRPARRALRRAAVLTESAEPLLTLASHPDLRASERVETLLEAYFSPEADQAAVKETLEDSGAFASAAVLRAALDARRIDRAVPAASVTVEPLPDFRVATDTRTFVSSELLAAGKILVLYFPEAGCPRASEELDRMRRALDEARGAGVELELAGFVTDPDLAVLRRFARLLAIRLEVGPLDRLPASIEPNPGGEVRLVGRGGFLQVRFPLDDRDRIAELDSTMTSALEVLQEPMEEDPWRAPPVDGLWKRIERVALLEAGPGPFEEAARLESEVRAYLRAATSREETLRLLEALSPLEGSGRAKGRVLLALDRGYAKTLLEAARGIDPEVSAAAADEEGAFRVATAPSGLILLQRSFTSSQGELRHFDFVLELEGESLAVRWTGPQPHAPEGAEAHASGAVFHFSSEEGCRGLRRVSEKEITFEGCPAWIADGAIWVGKRALVDDVSFDEAPFYANPVPGGAETTPLEEGLRAFEAADYPAAARAFERALETIDPHALYGEADVRYNLARSLEEQGQRQQALALFRTIGDVLYQDLVDERIGLLEGTLRR